MSDLPGSRGNAAAAETLSVIQELQDLALDPAMDECCRRDVQEQIRAERIRHSLQQRDRVDARQRLAAATLCTDTQRLALSGSTSSRADGRSPAQQQPNAQHEQSMTPQQHQQQQASYSDEEEGDVDLQRLRQQRLQQLKAQTAEQQEQRQAGFGTLNTVQESNVMALCCEDPPGRGYVVAHLAVQGYEPCNALDEYLEEASGQYRGTYFARCVVSRNSPLVSRLQLSQGVPALLVAKHGALLGKAHISRFGGDDLWSEEVWAYLHRFKVLHTGDSSSTRQARSSTVAGSAVDTDSSSQCSDEEAAGDWQSPCEVCGRTYPHEHIRSLYSSRQPEGSDEDDDV